MWEELKEKAMRRKAICHALRVKWASDGESGTGEIVNMDITDDYINFIIRDDNPEVGVIELRSAREFLGANGDVNGLRIPARYMGEIVILPDKKEEDAR